MKKILICVLLLVAMTTGTLSVYAAPPQMSIQVLASSTQVHVGQSVEYTVLATGSDVVALQFQLKLPAGLRYVSNSAATPEGLAQKLGVPAAEWTEQSMMFTFYNDVGITIPEDTQLLSFTCVVEQEGSWTPELFELIPFDSDFQAFSAESQIQTVLARNTLGETEPAEPAVNDATEPANVSPDPDIPAQTDPDEQSIPSELEPAPPIKEPDLDDLDTLPEEGLDDNGEEVLTVGTLETEPAKINNSVLYIVIGTIVALLVAGGVAVVVITKKKRS